MSLTYAVLNIITSYDPGAGNTGVKRPQMVVCLNDYRLYDFASMTALPLFNAYGKFELSQPLVPQPVAWPMSDAYAKAVYSIPLVPLPAQAHSGAGPYTYTSGTSRTAAYDASTAAALLNSLTVSILAYSSQSIHAGETNGLDTAKIRVYGAYVNFNALDPSVKSWAVGATALPGNSWASGAGPAPGSPTTVLNAALACDTDDTTYAEIQETNKIVGLLSFSALWNPAKLVLDWVGVEPPPPPPPPPGSTGRNHSFFGVMGMGSGANASFAT